MLKAQFYTYTLDFKFLAGTSRGTLKQKKSWYLKVWVDTEPNLFGIGEAGPLPGLSIDYDESKLIKAFERLIDNISGMRMDSDPFEFLTGIKINPYEFPSVLMALETAILDLSHQGKREIFKNQFYQGIKQIPINGLIWMGNKEFMLNQIDNKLREGFDCIKIKVGALDFETEIEVLSYLREKSDTIEIRLDANGAFSEDEVFTKLDQLSRYGIHSIEQPVRQGNLSLMEKVIERSPIKVALDEELIGIDTETQKFELLERLKPEYIILKPTLLGGFASSRSWIEKAEEQGISWWITSALESNVGLNGICQFTAEYDTEMYQGLGTGSLYENNIPSPLEVKDQKISYRTESDWDMSSFQ